METYIQFVGMLLDKSYLLALIVLLVLVFGIYKLCEMSFEEYDKTRSHE